MVNRTTQVINNNPLEDLLAEDCDFNHEPAFHRSPIIKFNIGHFEFPAMVDTGSEASCLAQEVFDQIINPYPDIPTFPVYEYASQELSAPNKNV